MTIFREKRAYDAPAAEDGFRIYVDRLWPRGLSHENFHYDVWEKDLAPSSELRHWFHEDPTNRWEEFAQKYARELDASPALEAFENLVAAHPVVTLLYSSREAEHNNATVLKIFLQEHMGPSGAGAPPSS